MFTRSTINSVVRRLLSARRMYDAIPIEDLKLCLSTGNRKIGKTLNVSLPPLVDGCGKLCHDCGCDGYCYAVRDCFLRGDVVINARSRNWSILRRNRDEYFRQIDDAMSRRRKNKYFRWHVSGEIPDDDYFSRMIDNARKHPDFIIWTYTKQYSIVNRYCAKYGRDSIPANFSIMFSRWEGFPMDNPFSFPEFVCVMVSKGASMDDCLIDWTCPGNCGVCLEAGRGCPFSESGKVADH